LLVAFRSQKYLYEMAYDCYQKQEYSIALKYAQKCIKKAPENVPAILLLANIYYALQNYSQACDLYHQVLDIDSQHLVARINIADIYIIQKKYAQAQDVIKKIEPIRYADFLWGKLYFAQENYALSEEHLYRFLSLEKDNYWAWNLLSQAAQKNKHYQSALDAALKAVEISNGADSQHLNMAYALYEIAVESGKECVIPTLKKWYQKYSQNIIVQQVRNCFFSSSDSSKSDSLYIKKIFDEFADSFDDVLRNLDYIVPTKISQITKINMQDILDKKISILDLGCGTGLCAQSMKKTFKNAVFYGVDISSKMLEQAAAKNIYKKLINADIETYLFEQKNKYEMIVAADVFTYFGDLKKLFEGMYNSLKKDSIIAFSISELSTSDSMWKQHLSGRFLHSKNYIKNLLSETGFCHTKFAPCILRKEGDKNVKGWIIFSKKTQ